MKILDRYILKEFIKSFIISVFSIYGIFILQMIIKLLDKFLGKGFSFLFLGKLLFYNTAWILAMAIPMAILVSTILTYGKLSSNNEVLGLKSSGIKIFSIIKAPLIASIIISVIMIIFSCDTVPEMNHKSRQLFLELKQKRPDVEFEEGIWETLPPIRNEQLNIKFNKRSKNDKSKFYDVTIHQIISNKLKRTILADSVKIINNDNIIFDLYNGSIHEKNHNNEEYREIIFDNYKLSYIINQKNRTNFTRSDRELTFSRLNYLSDSLKHKINVLKHKINRKFSEYKIDTMNIEYNKLIKKSKEELQKELLVLHEESPLFDEYYKRYRSNIRDITWDVNQIKRHSTRINKYTVETHKKFAIPIASTIFLLIGAPLGIALRRGSIPISMSISLAFFVLYYIFIVGGEQLADRNLFNPALSMWLPNIIISILGTLVFYISYKINR